MASNFFRATALGSAAFGSLWTVSVPVTAQPFDWTGFYVGINAGVVHGAGPELTYPETPGGVGTVFEDNTPRARGTPLEAPSNLLETQVGGFNPWPTRFEGGGGLAFGAHTGYNWQVGSVVFGLEGDASLLGARQNHDFNTSESFSSIPLFGYSRDSELNVQGGLETLFTLRPRVGVTTGRALFYGTGGAAFGRASLSTSASLTESYFDVGKAGPPVNATGQSNWEGSVSDWRLGWTLGGGAEYAASDRLTLRAEALYYNLGTLGVTATGTGSYDTGGGSTPMSVAPYNVEMDLSGVIARIGFSYRL
jgi:outer membrane immunogenic protein